MRRSIRPILFISIMAAFIASTIWSIGPTPVSASDTKDVVKKAREAIYSLKAHGLEKFHCNIEPNWKRFVDDNFKGGPGPDETALKILRRIQFSVDVGESDAPKLAPFLIGGGTIDGNFDEMLGGLQQMFGGFYQTWTSLVLSNPFSANDDAMTVKEEGENYRLNGVDGTAKVEVLLTKSFVISEMKVFLPDAKVVLHPKFIQVNGQLLLNSLSSDINDGQTQVYFDIEYADIEGLKLPSKIVIKVPVPGREVVVEAAFTKYQVTRILTVRPSTGAPPSRPLF